MANIDTIHVVANYTLIVSLLLGVASTFAIIVTGNIKEIELKRELSAAAERTATLEKEAAAARLETESLKSSMAWRRISIDQYNILITSLKGKVKEGVWVEFVQTDPEATLFRADIWKTLEDAGLKLHYFGGWERAVGLQITNTETEEGKLIASAFESAGIPFVRRSEPGLKSAKDKVEIIVGSKPPLFFTPSTNKTRLQ